jgi:putative MATE family efflux protein
MKKSERFGTASITQLLVEQSLPAAIGILVMSLNIIVDTIFVGRFIGPLGIGAITVVMPIIFLISSIGMALGIGGSSVFSRALGSQNVEKSTQVWGNMVSCTILLSLLFVILGFAFGESIITLFGGKGDLISPSATYFRVLLYGVSFLAWAMMTNPVIRALGFPKLAMLTLIIPSILNVILDPIFIIVLDMGIAGAGWASSLSYLGSGLYTAIFLFSGRSELSISWKHMIPRIDIIREMFAIGSVTLARQGTIAILTIVLNNSLFFYGAETAVSVYGIASRCMMFALFPVMGITQGFLPVAGYNYGARHWDRVRLTIRLSMGYATLMAGIIFSLIMFFTPQIVSVFTTDQSLINQTTPAMRWLFLATPLIGINLIGSAYYQAIGRAIPALLLALTKQGIFLIPLVLLLPLQFGINGIWYAFPVADIGAAIVTLFYMRRDDRSEYKKMAMA